MIYSLMIIGVIVAAIYYYRRWQALPKEQQKKAGKVYALWVLAAVMLVLVLAGRAHWLMGVLAALLAVAGRVAQLATFVPIFKKLFGQGDDVQSPVPTQMSMDRQQAAEILGIELNASDKEIRLAHKSLMQKIHPDRGGTDALAKQINQAKDVLLKR